MGASGTTTTVTDNMPPGITADGQDSAFAESVQHKIADEWAAREICPPWRAAVIGCGNTGSQLAMLLARIEGLQELWLVDPDTYEARNMRGQGMPGGTPPGTSKVQALAAVIRQIRPDLRVVAVADRVENLPPGDVFGASSVVFGNLDGPAARRYVVEQAWLFSTPVIDCGVKAEGRLIRITVFLPEFDLPCFICSVDPAAGGVFEQTYPCAGGEPAASAPPTDAPAWLGALAASFQMAEFEKIVSPGACHLLAGKELLVDTKFHQHYVSTIPRNAKCPFHHRSREIERLGYTPGDLSVARAFALALPPGTPTGGNLPRFLRGTNMSLTVPTKQFVRTMQGSRCDCRQSLLRLRHRLRDKDRACPRGHGDMVALPHEIEDRVYAASLDWEMSRSLYSLGFRTADSFTISGQYGERHFLLRCRRAGAVDEAGPGGFDPAEGESSEGRREAEAEDDE